MKKRGGTLNAYNQVKEVNLRKPTCCMILTVEHSAKGKTVEMVKRLMISRVGITGRGRMKRWSREKFQAVEVFRMTLL